MPTARHVKQPKFTPTTRQNIDVSFYSKVDAALRDLRTCSRQIGPVLLSMEDELRILERLYYKGKNQHRSALFWRHVSGMRRICGRLLTGGKGKIGEVLEELKNSFYGDAELSNKA